MDLRNPLRIITPTLDADVLRVLAQADKAFTGREIHRLVGRGSQEGVRLALARLARQGIVDGARAGRATLFRLNRAHLASPYIIALATLRLELINRLRASLADWQIQPVVAALFGSAARGESDETSDIDVLVVRPPGTGVDDDVWRSQIALLESSTGAWTGNDTRVLEYGAEELSQAGPPERVLETAGLEGIVLAGDLRLLRGAATS